MAVHIKQDRRNYRQHNKKNLDLIEKSLQECQCGRSILIDNQNEIIAGNGAFQVAQKLNIPVKIIETDGKELIAVKRTDLKTNDEKRKKLAILDNSTTDTSEFNLDLLAEDYNQQELQDLGIEIELEDVPVEQVQEDDIPEEVETRTKSGDLWKLGDHFLFVGDSTKQEDIDRLMQGNIADMVMTDPPYNVDYTGKTKKAMKIQNDKMDVEYFDNFLTDLFITMASVLKKGGSFYIFYADTNRKNFQMALEKTQTLEFKQNLIWVKNHFVMGRQDYNWQHEPCLYGWKQGAGHYFIEEFNHSTVQEQIQNKDINKLSKEELIGILKQLQALPTDIIKCDRPSVSDLHPTSKPVKLLALLIRNSSKPNEIVLDVCGGSGSTLMACEQLGRRCYINEIDPQYADVIIQRWENFTGQKAQKVTNK